jgi:hypothetical protein
LHTRRCLININGVGEIEWEKKNWKNHRTNR